MTVGGVGLVELPLDQLRGHVVLVTQEQHVFAGTLRDNLSLARPGAGDAALRAALDAVDALGWADALPDGLDTVVGAGAHTLSAAQAQQVALARWSWPTRTRWCSTRPPRCSTPAPPATWSGPCRRSWPAAPWSPSPTAW